MSWNAIQQQKGINYWYTTTWMNFKKIMLWKKPIPKAYMLHDLIYVNSENDKLTEMENTLVIVWGRGAVKDGKELNVVMKGQCEGSLWCWNCLVSWLWCWTQGHTHMIRLHRTKYIQTHKCSQIKLENLNKIHGLYVCQYLVNDIVNFPHQLYHYSGEAMFICVLNHVLWN